MKKQETEDDIIYTFSLLELQTLLISFGKGECRRISNFYTEDPPTSIDDVNDFLKDEGLL